MGNKLKTGWIVVVMLFGYPMGAQTKLGIDYNSTGSGINLSFNISKEYRGKHEVGVGIRYNINRLKNQDDQSLIFRNRLFATKPIQFFGIESFYEKRILNHWEGIEPFVFYHVQMTYSTTRNRNYSPYGILNNIQLYQTTETNFGPFIWIDQSIGVGFRANINSNWYIKQRLGVGTMFIIGHDDELLSKIFRKFDWEFSEGLSVGVGYKLNNIVKKQ